MTNMKNTIRDGGSTALYTAYTVFTVYAIQTALYCLNCNLYAYVCILLGKVNARTKRLEWADALLSKKLDGVE